MSKIPFNIKYRPQIESGEYKVETRDGRPVRVICWDRKYGFPICGLATEADGHESYVNCYFDGSADSTKEDSSDLFIVTSEEELTEFEKRIENLLNLALPEGHAGTTIENTKRVAAELLAVARKEIMDGWSNGLRDTQDQSGKAYSDGYKLGHENGKSEALKEIEQDPESSYAFKRGVEYGKEEALKDLPRWKRAAASFGNYSVAPTDTGQLCLLIDGYYIMLSDLKKLPGFND